MHLAGVDAARGHRHQLVEAGPVLIEEHAMFEFCRIEVLAADVVIAARRRRIAFELADNRAGMNVIDAGEPHPFRDHAERDAMVALPRVGRMSGPMQMQDHVVAARPFRHRLDRGVADHEINHDDDRAEFLGELGALVHVFHGPGGDVEIGALDLAGRRLRLVDRFHAVEKPLAPMHERLRVDVLIVLGEVEAALQRLIDHAAIIAAGKPELRLHGRAEQRTAELVHAFALDHDAGRRPLKRLHIGHRQPHVLEPQRLQRLETEHVADDRGRKIGDRSVLEQIEIIGDVGEILPRRIRHGIDAVAFGAIFLRRRQTVGPHHRPGRGRGFPGDRRRGLDRIDAVLRRDPEQRDDVGVLGLVIGLPIAHLLVFHDAGFVAILAADGHRLVVHGILLCAGGGRDRGTFSHSAAVAMLPIRGSSDPLR